MPDYVTVQVDSLWLVMPAAVSREVAHIQHITPIPLTEDVIAGMMHLRGEVVCIIDLYAVLGLGTRPQRQGRELSLIVEQNGTTWSLLIDRVGDVLSLEDHDAMDVPVHLPDELSNHFTATYYRDQELVHMLSLESVITTIGSAQPSA